MYQYGQGVTKNDQEALKWYRLAAAQGDTIAIEHLENYRNGVWVR
jgi:TPR repeat protein